MVQINREYATEKLKEFLTAARIERASGVLGPVVYRFARPQAEAQAAAQIAEQIFDRVLPGWRTADWEQPRHQPMWREREAAHRALAQLKSEQELIDNLGDGAPQLSASTLHPWVWDSARTLWSSLHFLEAVAAAAKSINAQTQTKLARRDASDLKLLSDAFSTNQPIAGHPRLRLMPDDGSETFRNLHDGAANFSRGVYSAIRNPAAHEESDEIGETEALEYLACFSVLARWVDSATVERV
jgi:uncharacterized protein (TIGR02391 family)